VWLRLWWIAYRRIGLTVDPAYGLSGFKTLYPAFSFLETPIRIALSLMFNYHSHMLAKIGMQSPDIFPWNENFATGIPIIDEQHRQLVYLINLLASHLTDQSDLTALNDVFNQLAEYADYHFQTEERIWHEYFPGDSWETSHKKTHESFIESVINLKAEEKTKSFHEVVEDALLFLTQWLAYHILYTDMRMAKVALRIQSGASFVSAKQAEPEMESGIKLLIQNILQMYESLASRTLELSREINVRQ